MSINNLVACPLIMTGLLIATVPTFANDHADHSRSARSTASRREQRDSPSDRMASVTEREQRHTTYGGQDLPSSVKDIDSKHQSLSDPVPFLPPAQAKGSTIYVFRTTEGRVFIVDDPRKVAGLEGEWVQGKP